MGKGGGHSGVLPAAAQSLRPQGAAQLDRDLRRFATAGRNPLRHPRPPPSNPAHYAKSLKVLYIKKKMKLSSYTKTVILTVEFGINTPLPLENFRT